MKVDFSKVTFCGGCCDDCSFKISGECQGCVATGGERVWQGRKSTCEISSCCKAHNVSFCGICTEFPCNWLAEKIGEWDKDGIEKLKRLKSEYAKVSNT